MAKFTITKEIFIDWHDEHTWKILCEPLYKQGIDKVLKETCGENKTIESFIHYDCILKISNIIGMDPRYNSHLKKWKEKMCLPTKRILIHHGHHGDSYYDASSGEDLDKAAFKIFENEFDSFKGYYSENEEEIKNPTFTQEETDKLPAGSVKDAALEELEYHKQCLKEQRNNREKREMIEKIKKNKDGRLAYQLLQIQGERMELEIL